MKIRAMRCPYNVPDIGIPLLLPHLGVIMIGISIRRWHMPWYTSVEGDSMLSLPNGSLYLTEGRGAFNLEYRAVGGAVIHTWVINVPSLYEARRLSMDIVRNYLLGEVKYLETTNPTVGVQYSCDSPTLSGCGKVRVGCSACGTAPNTPCKCKRVYATIGGNCA